MQDLFIVAANHNKASKKHFLQEYRDLTYQSANKITGERLELRKRAEECLSHIDRDIAVNQNIILHVCLKLGPLFWYLGNLTCSLTNQSLILFRHETFVCKFCIYIWRHLYNDLSSSVIINTVLIIRLAVIGDMAAFIL